MENRRLAAVLTLLLIIVGLGWLAATAVSAFPHGLISATLIVIGLALAWEALRRVGTSRAVYAVLAAVAMIGAIVDMLFGKLVLDLIFVAGCLGGSYVFAKQVFRLSIPLPPAPRPAHAVVFWNPNSGGGKAAAVDLARHARVRGIEPVELTRGADLAELARRAVANGADALAAAGGDGTQAIVAGVAAEYDLPFAVIPAGTRNHFALDLGVDRNDVVGALDAFVNGGERRVDLGEVNGQIFVNNVSIGLYAEAVARESYRGAKFRTILETAPDLIGVEAPVRELGWSGPGGTEHSSAAVILVSNNTYRVGLRLGAGTRPRIDDATLGVTVVAGPHERGRGAKRWRLPWRQWTASTFEVASNGPVPVGIDGEAAMLDAPLRFTIRPAALRVRISPNHPGVSPSAAQPEGLRDALQMLWQIASGQNPVDVFAHHHR